MRKTSLLILLLVASGCATRVWTETTDTVRTTGGMVETTEDVALDGEFFELRTEVEVDGYGISDTISTNEHGVMQVDTLSAGLQVLAYGHDVTLELLSYTEDKVVWSRVITDANARETVREVAVQAKLGAEVRMRTAQADLLDRAIEKITEPEVRDNLESIRLKVTIRPDWE
ncbi:MAG: hypothetical protein K8I27_00960 [Planctomycetes bacterium]|nr:hypothetical protein [Planctomycetota bacterium]